LRRKSTCEEADPVSPAPRCRSVTSEDTPATDRVTSGSSAEIERPLFGGIIRHAALGWFHKR
jgi:hypothetical protein